LEEIQNMFWDLEGLLSSRRRKSNLNKKNSGLEEERSHSPGGMTHSSR
jgi:hypothetical protein